MQVVAVRFLTTRVLDLLRELSREPWSCQTCQAGFNICVLGEAVTNAVSWRPEGIKHKKNEIFLDVVEKLNLLVSSNGSPPCNCFLLGIAGMTEERLTQWQLQFQNFDVDGKSN